MQANEKHAICYKSWAMHRHYGFLFQALFRRYFAKIGFSEDQSKGLQKLSEEGLLIYIMESASIQNYLFLNYWLSRLHLPLAYFGNGISFLLCQPLKIALAIILERFRYTLAYGKWGMLEVRRYFQSLIRNQQSVVLFLKKPSPLFPRSDIPVKDFLEELVALQGEIHRPIYLIPIGIIWGKRPEKAKKSLIDILFGEKETPGLLRHMVLLLRHARNSFVAIGDVLNLREFLQSHLHLDQDLVVKKVRWALHRELTLERHAITGPTLKPRKFLIASVLSSHHLRDMAREIAQQEGKPFEKIMKEAEKYAEEIAADYNITYIEFLEWILTWVWNNIYSGFYIDKEGLECVKRVLKHSSLILLPCHKSHVDYLVLSYIFYQNNLPPPHIAAGVNLSFWPLGHIFRRAGAFFIRRSIRGQRLYSTVFSTYMKKLLREGYVQEFFLEGTRSRTGKLLPPRFGMLSMEIDAFAEGACEELNFAPISITYEKVVEEASYTSELGGAIKKKEKFIDLLKTPRFLFKKYGRVYIQFAPPIALRALLQEQRLDLSQLDVRMRRKVVEDLAQRVSYAINEVITVTPSSLLATALLNHNKRGITQEELLQWVSFLLRILKEQEGVRVSLTLRNVPWAVEEALGVFVADRLVQRFDDPEGTIFMVEETKRMNLDYYKNNILHFFVPFSFAAGLFAIYESESLDEGTFQEGLSFFMRMFRREFIFPPQNPVENYRRKIQEYLIEKRGFLSLDPSGRISQSDPMIMGYFSRLLYALFESYLVVIRTLERWEENAKEERAVLKEIMATADRLYRRGDLLKYEAMSMLTFRNAIELCIEEGFLTRMETKGGDRKLLIKKEVSNTLRLYRTYLERILSLEGSPDMPTRTHQFQAQSPERGALH